MVPLRLRPLQRQRGGLTLVEGALLALLTAWALAPVAAMVWHAATSHDLFTGADGAYATDQLEYLAWVRQAGRHLLIANPFTLGPEHPVFLHPMFVVSGGLWRAGMGIALAYQLWRPVAVAILFIGSLAYVRRSLPRGGGRAVALLIALFFSAPAAALVNWLHIGSPATQLDYRIVGGELFEASRLWGYLPSIIAAGLVPLVLLGVERMLAQEDRTPRLELGVVAAGCLAAWFHPWQGEILVVMLVLLVLWRRADRRCLRLLLPVLATGAPLLYYLALRHGDATWRIAGGAQLQPVIPLGVLALCLAPLALPAILGVPGTWRSRTTHDQLLLMWVPVALVTYLAGGAASQLHLLEGLSLPLGVLAVRAGVLLGRSPAWGRSPRGAAVLLTILLAALVVPGTVYMALQERDNVRGRLEPNYLRPGEIAALRYLQTAAPPGGVISTRYLAAAVPVFTDRQAWDGFYAWTPDWSSRVNVAGRLFSGRLRGPAAITAIRATGARLLLADCRGRADLTQTVGARYLATRHFGCAAVYAIRG